MDNKELAAKLVDNFDRTKQADFAGNVKQLLAGAGRQAGSYLRDPKNVVARNALIGGGVGGLAGLASSSRGRRISDTLRGALLGGSVGGAGTLAYRGLRGVGSTATANTVPEELQAALKEPKEDMLTRFGSYRPLAWLTGAAAAAPEVDNLLDIKRPDRSFSKRVSAPGFMGMRTGKAIENIKAPSQVQRDNTLAKMTKMIETESADVGRFQKMLSGGGKHQNPGMRQFTTLMENAPDDSYRLIQEATKELKKPSSPSSLGKDLAPPTQSGGVGGRGYVTGSNATQAVNKPPVSRATDFEEIRDRLAKKLKDADADDFRQLSPNSFRMVNQRSRPIGGRLGRLGGRLGLIGGVGYLAEPTLWQLLSSGSNLVGRPQNMSPEEIQQAADQYLAAQG